jgi:hypothetical protein
MRAASMETRLDALIHDGIVRLMMKSDGVSPESLRRLLRHISDARAAEAAVGCPGSKSCPPTSFGMSEAQAR